MADALAWIGELARWLASWIPRLVIVKANYLLVKFVRGKHVRVVQPGLAIYWPLVTVAKPVFVARSVMNLTNQTLTTKDGRVLVVSGVVAFQISDVALSSIKHVIVEATYEQLLGEQQALDARLTRRTRSALRSFGVEVEYVRLTDFAPARALSIAGLVFPERETAPLEA